MGLDLKIKNILFILLGSAIFGFGIVHFNIENHLAEGGFTGITLILLAKLGINPSYTNLALNIPVFIIGWRMLGKKSFLYTIIGTVSSYISPDCQHRLKCILDFFNDWFDSKYS